MPPIFKMCPKPNCRRRLYEKKFFSRKQWDLYQKTQGNRANLQKYECRRCMKYYENYMPSYTFTAEMTDPISQMSMHIKFFNKTGQTLVGVPPQEFESAMDFKVNTLKPGMEQEGGMTRDIEDRLKHHKNHQLKIFNTRIYRQFLLLVKSDYFSPFNNNKQDHKL